MSMSQSLGGNAAPIIAVIGDKEYKFGLLTQKIKSGIERIVQSRARTELFRDKNDMGDEEFKLAYGAYMDRISSGAFAFGGVNCRGFLTSTDGLANLVHLMAGISLDEGHRLVAEYSEEIAAVVGQIFTESFRSTRKAEIRGKNEISE